MDAQVPTIVPKEVALEWAAYASLVILLAEVLLLKVAHLLKTLYSLSISALARILKDVRRF